MAMLMRVIEGFREEAPLPGDHHDRCRAAGGCDFSASSSRRRSPRKKTEYRRPPGARTTAAAASTVALLLLLIIIQCGEGYLFVVPPQITTAPAPGHHNAATTARRTRTSFYRRLPPLFDVPPEADSSSSSSAGGGIGPFFSRSQQSQPSSFPFFPEEEEAGNDAVVDDEDSSTSGKENCNGERSYRVHSRRNGAEEEHHHQSKKQQQQQQQRNGASSLKKNGMKQSSSSPPPPPPPTATAPEVTHWTEVMSQGWLNDSPTATAITDIDSKTMASASTVWEDCKVLTEYDFQQIEQYWIRLLPTVNYLGTVQVAKIYRALCVAYRAHRGQMRKSGDPFIIHPVEVSVLLGNLKMDGETVMAGLLHDTVEDTELTFDQIESMFGNTVRSIVEGETKVSKLPKLAFTDYADEQAENLRQMFVAMTDDYRIIIVKLADRLHNMRTLRHMKPEKQIKISRETLDIFAPLAHRMGIWQFKSELEDTAFMYLYPQEYKRLNRRLRQYQSKFRETLDKSQEILQKQLDQDPTLRQQAAKVEVFGRTKELYSLWHKMETKGEHNLENIVDVVALRVIITPHYGEDDDDNSKSNTNDPNSSSSSSMKGSENSSNDAGQNKSDRGVWLCYHVLGLVQHLPGFQPVPTRVKDYISFPKPNGYQSLHTALNLNGQTIEVQIRTRLMHQVAEYGMASHWAYTDIKRRVGGGGGSRSNKLYNTPWLSSIKEWQNDRISSRDFVDSVRRELLGKRVFVFLRNGKILNLSRGATAIDAAFQIHTEVGLNMHGVEINGKPVPFSTELQNGDVVSILTGEGGKPSTDWMRYAKSRSTRSKLRSYFRAQQKESLHEAGEIILLNYLKMHGSLIESSSFLSKKGEDFRIPTSVEEVQKFLPGKSRFRDVDDLLVAIGKHHDRSLLHTVAAQIFAVPKKYLVAAEENHQGSGTQLLVPSSVVAAVHERRRQTSKSVSSASTPTKNTSFEGTTTTAAEDKTSFSSSTTANHNWESSNSTTTAAANIPTEYADSEHLCEDCLPIHGDQIIGTRPAGSVNDAPMSITTVHRMGCPHAQRAVNQAAAHKRQSSISAAIKGNGICNDQQQQRQQVIDSVSLRRSYSQRLQQKTQNSYTHKLNSLTSFDEPVPLRWSDLDDYNNNSNTLFFSEVVVHAHDRKLLLADCSEVVSEAAEIVKTGSSSNEEHACLVFLVQVGDIHQLQNLMDRLSEIRSVMAVERRFGSELLVS